MGFRLDTTPEVDGDGGDATERSVELCAAEGRVPCSGGGVSPSICLLNGPVVSDSPEIAVESLFIRSVNSRKKCW